MSEISFVLVKICMNEKNLHNDYSIICNPNMHRNLQEQINRMRKICQGRCRRNGSSLLAKYPYWCLGIDAAIRWEFIQSLVQSVSEIPLKSWRKSSLIIIGNQLTHLPTTINNIQKNGTSVDDCKLELNGCMGSHPSV